MTTERIKTQGKGAARRRRMRRKRMPRKEGSSLTNNHSRSITTDDSSVAEDETLYARHARQEPVNHRTLVSYRGEAEAPETEFHKAHEAWWSDGRFESSGMHQTMRAITMHSSHPSAPSRSPQSPRDNTRQMYHLICQYCPTFVSVSVVRLSGRRVRTTGWLSADR